MSRTWHLCPRCSRRTTDLREDPVLGEVCDRCADEAERAREYASPPCEPFRVAGR